MKITILHISDSDKHFGDMIQEYQKRLGKKITVKTVKPIKHGSKKQIVEKETELIKEKLIAIKSDKVYLLSILGENYTTHGLHKLLSRGTCTLVIGGPYGLIESEIDQLIDGKISLGKHTMPHGLVKLVILEQIYRCDTLSSGKKYHY